mmetsp:Transcript_111644/g.326532  ORF Transcript_111644/g.326532 Transcript_111644/m.326532 type:complete len:460 (-) Transcript_111644:1632-3011(-)
MLPGIRARPCKCWRADANVHDPLPLDRVRRVDDVVVLVANDDVEGVHLRGLRGHVGLHGEGVGADGERSGEDEPQGIVYAVGPATGEADLLQGAPRGAGEAHPGGRHHRDLGAARHVRGEGEADARGPEVGDAAVGDAAPQHLRDEEARALAPAGGRPGALAPALHVPGDAVRRHPGRLHPDLEARELRQRHARRGGDLGGAPPGGAQGLPGHAILAAARGALVEGEAGRRDDQELAHHGAPLVDVQRDLDDGPGGAAVRDHPQRHALDGGEARRLAVVRVCGVREAVARVEAPGVGARLGEDPHDHGVGRVGLERHLRRGPAGLERGLERPGRVQLHVGVHLARADDHEGGGPEGVGAGALARDDELLRGGDRQREGEPELGLGVLQHPRLKERLDRELGPRLAILALQLRRPQHRDPARKPEAPRELEALVSLLSQRLVRVGDQVEARLSACPAEGH